MNACGEERFSLIHPVLISQYFQNCHNCSGIVTVPDPITKRRENICVE